MGQTCRTVSHPLKASGTNIVVWSVPVHMFFDKRSCVSDAWAAYVFYVPHVAKKRVPSAREGKSFFCFMPPQNSPAVEVILLVGHVGWLLWYFIHCLSTFKHFFSKFKEGRNLQKKYFRHV